MGLELARKATSFFFPQLKSSVTTILTGRLPKPLSQQKFLKFPKNLQYLQFLKFKNLKFLLLLVTLVVVAVVAVVVP